MDDTKKKRRRSYLESFHKDQKGNYVYEGEVYTYRGRDRKETDLKRNLARLWAAGIAMLACQVAAGCITAPGIDNCFYVLLPYAAGLVAGISVCWALGRLTAGGNPLKAYVYEASVKALPARTLFTAACAGLGIAGEAVFVCRNGIEGKGAGLCVFLALQILVLVFALLLRRETLLMDWVK